MKILYVDPFIMPDSMGGSQKSLLDIMLVMQDKGNEVILANPGEGMLTVKSRQLCIKSEQFFLPALIDTRITLGSQRIFNIFAAIYNTIILLLSGFSLLYLIRKKRPDVVHSNQMLVSIAVGFACKLGRVPCFWHIRENPAEHVPTSVIKIYALIGSFLSDQIIVNSKFTANIFRNTSAFKKIIEIPIGIDYKFDRNADKNLTLEKSTTKLLKKISIFGRIIPMKGHKVLIRSLKILKSRQLDFKLLILGHYDNKDKYYVSLLSLIENLDLKSNIEFHGFCPDIKPYLISSDLIVSASIESETFGRTILEAMAAGKPVIATKVGAHLEIIEDGVNGILVEPDDPVQLADSIEKILHYPKNAKILGEKGRQRYEKFFTLEMSCVKIENTYRRFLN
jgi:glycosyltransferase involved in cell wall biosynthesis